jgi:hypothetical protein
LNGQQTPLEPKIYDEEEGTDNELKQTANKYNEEAKRVWEGVKKMREEGKLHTPTQEDIENEPNALAFTQHEIEEDYTDEEEDTDVVNEEVKVDEETGVIELPEELLEVPISEEIVEVQPLAEPDGTGLLSYMDVIEPVKEERIIRKEDIKEIKERGFSVAIPKRDKNTIQRIGSNKEIRNGEEDKIFFNKNK